MLQKGSLYEYSLYASIILLSGMGVASLPSYLDETPVSPVNVYTATMYLAFLGWAFCELHRLHGVKSGQRTAAGPTLVRDGGVVAERPRHSNDLHQADDPQTTWMNRLHWTQRATVRLGIALGGKINTIERSSEVAKPVKAIEPKEKPEAA